MDKKTQKKKLGITLRPLKYYGLILGIYIATWAIILYLIPRNSPYFSFLMYFFTFSTSSSSWTLIIFDDYNKFVMSEQERYGFIYFLRKENKFKKLILLIFLAFIVSFISSFIIHILRSPLSPHPYY